MDFEYAQTVEVTSQEFTIANYNSTYYGFSEVNNFVYDQRGYHTFLLGEADIFLKPSDPRLLLNTIVTNITYSHSGVKILTNSNAPGGYQGCIEADYALITFSVGVLQSGDITFSPELPTWKQIAIQTFQMGIYTKIFFQFPPDKIFWSPDYQYLLYASPQRGYYPIFQPLDLPEFVPGSGIFFATVVTDQSRKVEAQSDEETKQEILTVLREMFGTENVPEPIDFMYPRWGKFPWAYGSYSNWPPGLTLEGHQNLRANVGRVYFAGEATSAEYYGYLHGAWIEGKRAGEDLAELVKGAKSAGEKHYEVLHGTTDINEFLGGPNGWFNTSFQTRGDVDLEGGGG